MKIAGFSINKISAEKKSPIKGKLELKSNVDIKDILREDIQITKNAALKFDFEFSINYEPKVASILITGSIIAIDEKTNQKIFLKNGKRRSLLIQ